MTRLRIAAGRDDGFAMVMVLGMIVLLSVLAASMISVMQGEASRSRSSVKRDAAYHAAEAGVDDYISKLIDDHLYMTHFVHPGEATRLAAASGRTVGAGQAWLQADGGAWTYPSGKNNWYGAVQLGNGYEYDLEIFPPSQASPLIRIVSTGRPQGDADVRDWRELETLVRASSVSDFQMVADANISYGATATTYGKIYAGVDANNVAHNVNHDGTAYGDIYAEGSVSGNTTLMNGAKRYDGTTIRTVIRNKINFNNFLASLVDIRSAAGAGGIVEDNPAVDAWWLTFQPNGQVIVQSCMKTGGKPLGDVRPTCGAGLALALPANGAIYLGQAAIVSGTVNGRVTVGSASDILPGNTLTYFQSGDDVLGLVASHSVIVPQWAPTTMSWRAATIAQSGTFRSYGFDPQTGSEPDYVGNNGLTSMTFTGSTATYGGGSMALFVTRTYQYDSSLLYLPPPWFPTLQDAYTIILSRELAPTPS